MGQARLLVVEDDGLIRLDLVDTLADLGFDVLDAADADEAIALLEGDGSIAAVLTDIDMPGSMDGVQLAQVVHDRWPLAKVIVISGRYIPMEGALPPGTKFVTKPVSEKMVAGALEEVGVTV